MNQLKKLNETIVFMRLKTTSYNVNDSKIIEYNFVKIIKGRVIESLDGLLDPEIFISIDAQNYTGISDEMVKGKPKFCDIAHDVLEFIGSNALAGFRIISIDLPILIAEFKRCCKIDASFLEELPVIDLQVIFRRFHLGLAQVFRLYTRKSMSERHNSAADIQAMQMILNTQMEWYAELVDVDSINHFCLQPDRYIDRHKKLRLDIEGDVVFNFGKYLGRKLKSVRQSDPGYFQWILKKGDFPRVVKEICLEALNGNCK